MGCFFDTVWDGKEIRGIYKPYPMRSSPELERLRSWLRDHQARPAASLVGVFLKKSVRNVSTGSSLAPATDTTRGSAIAGSMSGPAVGCVPARTSLRTWPFGPLR